MDPGHDGWRVSHYGRQVYFRAPSGTRADWCEHRIGSWFSLRTEPETQKSEAPELGFPLFRVNQELTELAI